MDRNIGHRLIVGTPILMYHAFGASTEQGSRYVIPASRFARQMAWLKRMRYRVISLEEYCRSRLKGSLPPRRSVVITMDDGYADNWTVAYPILRRHGFPAVVFVVSGQIGGTYHSHIHSELDGRPMLSWSQIQTLALGGVEIGAHTRTHPDLTKIPLEQARKEIEDSRIKLERKVGVPIRVFSYPFGRYNREVQIRVEKGGFLSSCSVNTGLNTPITPLLALRRVEIYGTDSLLDFAIAVTFGERRESLIRNLKSFVTRPVGRSFWRQVRESGPDTRTCQ